MTGGSRGIGRGIARRLAEDGCAIVAFTYHSDTSSAQATAELVTSAGATAIPIRARLEEPEEIGGLFATLDAELVKLTGRNSFDIVINNAGSGGWDTLATSVPETFDRILAVHTRAPFFVTQASAERLRDGGRVINISSGWSTRPSRLAPVYSMAKAAVNAMTQALAAELGERAITVNTVAPGWTVTDGSAPARQDPAVVAQLEKDTVLGRIAAPHDIAAVVSMFASADAGWLTGQYVDANGGYRLE